jgi:benzoyl-CoA reductase/2-hydroxyglutaryl-CoA dehydratase subunit BcrC/BadD/HgdB
MEKVGFFTSIPVEVLIAAGKTPVDLNNIFINSKDPNRLINAAELFGFPRNYCAWVKGTFQALHSADIRRVIVVGEGECTSSFKQAEVLSQQGIDCVYFSYPHARKKKYLEDQITALMDTYDVSPRRLHAVLEKVHPVRAKLMELDRISFSEMSVSGEENYRWLISSSDFNGDLDQYNADLDDFLARIKKRDARFKDHIRIGIIGIPPIVNNLFAVIEELNGIVIFNEMPRQFSMPDYAEGLIEQYLRFTYPYDISLRLQDIKRNIISRKIDGIIHYCQSFCPRQLDEIVLKKHIDVPMLTLECDRPGPLDERNIIRIEAFLERWK